MGSRLVTFVLALGAFASCGASCKKNPQDTATADDNTPIIELPGVETSQLVPAEKREFSKVVRDAMSPCGDPVTLEVCVKEKRACAKCMPAAKAAAKLVSQGSGEKEIREFIENRFDDKVVKSIDVAGSPSIGPSDARILIVEFADFECPHCGAAAPVIHKVIESPELKPKIRFVFKNYPLPMHEHAEPAARAAVAAGQQGKFWEMHDQLFTHQEQLSSADIEGYAKKIGLNLDKFKLDWESGATKDRVAADKKIGGDVGVSGTPSLFINGRIFKPAGRADFQEALADWITLEDQLIAAKAGGAAPEPATSASAAASGSASAAPATSGSSSAKPAAASASASAAPAKK